MKQQFESVRSGFLLLLAAFIWGIAFAAHKNPEQRHDNDIERRQESCFSH